MKEEEDLVHQTAIAHLPLYMWCQSGELSETDDCGTQVNTFLVSIRVSQNGMLLVLVAYITGVQRHNVVQLMEGDLAFSMHVVVWCVYGVYRPS